MCQGKFLVLDFYAWILCGILMVMQSPDWKYFSLKKFPSPKEPVTGVFSHTDLNIHIKHKSCLSSGLGCKKHQQCQPHTSQQDFEYSVHGCWP